MTRLTLYLLAILLTMSGVVIADDIAKMSPEKLTLSFIKDFKDWNDYAMSLEESYDEKSGWKIGRAYDDLILKYCRESLKYQPLAYGSESRHNPEKEKIINVKKGEKSAIVYTKHERRIGNADLSNFYEYRFEWEANRWFLTSVAVVIDGMRYEGL